MLCSPSNRLVAAVASGGLAALLVGCVTTDGNGKPIARETRSQAAPMEVATANATLDGSEIVASGRPPLSFLYSGTGRLAVRDLTANTLPFSIALPDGAGTRTLIAIDANGKLTGTVSAGSGPESTALGSVDKTHLFVITYRSPGAAAAAGATR